MSDENLEPGTGRNLSRLVILGSVSSIAAFALVILDKIASVDDLPGQLVGWRFVFIIFSILGIGGFTVFTYHWVLVAYRNSARPHHSNVMSATVRALIGILIVGIFIDAFFAAVYWSPWMYGLVLLAEKIIEFSGGTGP